MSPAPADPPWQPPPADPVATPGAVDVWRIALDLGGPAVDRLAATLAPDELARADRLRVPRGRGRFIAGRGALRAILGRYLGEPAGRLAFLYGGRGKPALPGTGLEFNLTHSGGLALLAVARGRAVGVDIEEARPMADADRLVERFFSPREVAAYLALPAAERPAAFFRCWTRKEAYMKATGLGMGQPLDGFDVSLAPGDPPRLLAVAGRPGEADRWSMHDLHPGPGYAAALLVEGAAGAIRCYRWSADGPDEAGPFRSPLPPGGG